MLGEWWVKMISMTRADLMHGGKVAVRNLAWLEAENCAAYRNSDECEDD